MNTIRNTIRAIVLTVSAVLAVAGQPALAAETAFSRHYCVPGVSVARLHDYAINYDDYSRRPGAAYHGSGISKIGSAAQATLVKSQGKVTHDGALTTDALVWLVIQPLNLTDASLYPRFALNCQSRPGSSEGFTQTCSLISGKPHYGLDGFTSSIKAKAGDASCGNGQVSVDLNVKLSTDGPEILAIQTAIASAMGLPLAAVQLVFKEKTFFEGFFSGMYNGWVKDLAR